MPRPLPDRGIAAREFMKTDRSEIVEDLNRLMAEELEAFLRFSVETEHVQEIATLLE
jgi:uncharacterized protein (DUF433 family)